MIERALAGVKVTPIYPGQSFLDDLDEEDADLL